MRAGVCFHTYLHLIDSKFLFSNPITEPNTVEDEKEEAEEIEMIHNI